MSQIDSINQELLRLQYSFGGDRRKIPQLEARLAELRKTPTGRLQQLESDNKLITLEYLKRMGDDEHGAGGFVNATDAEGIRDSIKQFVSKLIQSDIKTTPSGTISIPNDPLVATGIVSHAYLPMVYPQVSKNWATWQGNLKKYDTKDGTLYGKNNTRLYVTSDRPTAGNGSFPVKLNSQAADLWQTQAVTQGADSSVANIGGSRSQLAPPNTRGSRAVYVESIDTRTKKPTLVKLSVDGSRNMQNFNKLDSRYTAEDKAAILNHLGYKVPLATAANQLAAVLKKAPLQAEPYMGSVLHSVPALATYTGKLDTNGAVVIKRDKQQDREDSLIYGSTDGALRMVDAQSGTQQIAFIPRAMFDDPNQRAAFVEAESSKNSKFAFGVDGPWSVNASYQTKYDKNQIATLTQTKMHAYGGLRMGGVGFYGLNLTRKFQPSLLFSINDRTAGFDRLGQTWSKPLVAKIKVPVTRSTPEGSKEVLVFGGGYDMCYENARFKLVAAAGQTDTGNPDTACNNKTQAQGNAVYMVDASNGNLLQKWDSGSAPDGSHMKHSIVADIVGRDRNNDGLVDHLYVADLGGQIFRIDLKGGVDPNWKTKNITRRVVRLFDANAGLVNHLPYRFYEKPAVSIHNTDGGRIAMVNVSSGDRSSPVHSRRELNDANRIFGIFDRDVATHRVTTDGGENALISRNLTNAHLNYYDTKVVGNSSKNAERKEFIETLQKGTKQGWYYTMTRFENYENVKNLKAVGSSITMNNIYYTNVYNPDYDYQKAPACTADIRGGTERQMFCLPWGICANPSTGALSTNAKNGTPGFNKLGPGLQEMTTLSQQFKDGKKRTVLIGRQTTDESEAYKRNYGGTSPSDWTEAMKKGGTKTARDKEGGNSYYPNKWQSESYKLNIKRWYDLADMGS